MRDTRPDWQQRLAEERIVILLGLARKAVLDKPERSRRYVELARRIGTRYRVRLPREMKESFCKKCSTPFVSGKTFTTRLDSKDKSVVIKCGNCNYSYRKRYK